MQNGEISAGTSLLSFDEALWVTMKYRGLDVALEASRAFLATPNLLFFTVDEQVIWLALGQVGKYKLHPRDAIHLATAITHGIVQFVSDDVDFDRAKEVNRQPLSVYIKP